MFSNNHKLLPITASLISTFTLLFTKVKTRYTNIRFKPVYDRVSCYNNSFIPDTVKQWNLLSREVVNIECSDHFTNSLIKYLSL